MIHLSSSLAVIRLQPALASPTSSDETNVMHEKEANRVSTSFRVWIASNKLELAISKSARLWTSKSQPWNIGSILQCFRANKAFLV